MKWNYCAYVVGPPEYGKTTIAAMIARRHLETMPTGILFVHDPVAQFAKHGCAYYATVDAWRVAAREASTKKTALPRGASIGGDASEVTALALELGEKMNRADAVRVPILLVYDEASLMDTSGSTYMGKLDNTLIATRRHRGVGLVFNLQDPGQLTSRFFRMGTDYYLLAQTSRAAAQLDERLYLEPGTMLAAGVTRLEMHQYLHVRQRVGVVAEPL